MNKKHNIPLYILGGVVVLYGIMAFFTPIIPMKGMLGDTPYRATWTQVYHHTASGLNPQSKVNSPNLAIAGATPRNSYIRGTTLFTQDKVYGSDGIAIKGANPKTYTQVDFKHYLLKRNNGSLPAFGYDKENIYVASKVIKIKENQSPFEAFFAYMASKEE